MSQGEKELKKEQTRRSSGSIRLLLNTWDQGRNSAAAVPAVPSTSAAISAFCNLLSQRCNITWANCRGLTSEVQAGDPGLNSQAWRPPTNPPRGLKKGGQTPVTWGGNTLSMLSPHAPHSFWPLSNYPARTLGQCSVGTRTRRKMFGASDTRKEAWNLLRAFKNDASSWLALRAAFKARTRANPRQTVECRHILLPRAVVTLS